MGVLIDTNILISAERNKSNNVLTGKLKHEVPHISVITVSELWHGVERATSIQIKEARAKWLEQLLNIVTIINIDTNIAKVHAKIWADLMKAGSLIGAHDLWIAATCVANKLSLLSADYKDFSRIQGLELVQN